MTSGFILQEENYQTLSKETSVFSCQTLTYLKFCPHHETPPDSISCHLNKLFLLNMGFWTTINQLVLGVEKKKSQKSPFPFLWGKGKRAFFPFFLVISQKTVRLKEFLNLLQLLNLYFPVLTTFMADLLNSEEGKESSVQNVSAGKYTCCINTYHSHSSSAQKIAMVISGKCFPIILNGLPVYRDSSSLLEIIEDNLQLSQQSRPFFRGIWMLCMIYILRQAEVAKSNFLNFRRVWVHGRGDSFQILKNSRSIWFPVLAGFNGDHLKGYCYYTY